MLFDRIFPGLVLMKEFTGRKLLFTSKVYIVSRQTVRYKVFGYR